ncbi:mannan-binding lectin [Mycobacterium vicinigordonae]|uniref:Mannan-binding lectin n=1 Tax=Mycobacterium vicinigordonae TaxID=1719132 RepID=A0A7D6E2Z4_9MYCO|nr:mannan-binding lectin [Mycobacterium vicinigordonae]
MVTAPRASASAEQFCAQLGATWDGTSCTTSVTSLRKAEMFISLGLPQPLLDNPTSGPVLRDYYQRLLDGWRKTGSETPRDSSASTDYQLYPGPGAVQSLIIHENFEPFGIQANNAYRSFVFDMAKGRRLTLADLFKPGVDPQKAIASATAASLPEVLDAAPPPHEPNTYPFTIREWVPGPDGPGYTGSYRAFALCSDHLMLYMPDQPLAREAPSPPERFVWSMDGGTITINVPLSSLASSLRTEYAGT